MDPLEDDDDIVWKENPFEVNSLDESEETPEQLLPMIIFEGSEQLQTRLKALVLEFIVFLPRKCARSWRRWNL